MNEVVILEDDDSIRKLVVYALENEGYKARGYDRPSVFWEGIREDIPSLLLLDLMLPEESGNEILKKLRSEVRTEDLPVIILTAKSSEYDRVEGLDAGADDYIVKPFGMMELLARVRAVLRRGKRKTEDIYENGCLTIVPSRYEVRVKGSEVTLTYKEFQLLCLLAENEGIVLNRSVLMDKIWDLGSERENRTLDVHIRTLRAKLAEAGAYIETVRGIGYRMKEAKKG